LIESNRENIPVQYVSHALETTNSSRNKTILGSGDHQVIGSPSSNQGKIPLYKLIVSDKSPSATMPCDLVSETGGKNNS
jgi:hypothetical protein